MRLQWAGLLLALVTFGAIAAGHVLVRRLHARYGKEIGVKRAVGATRANIIFQFFMETFFIISLGSIIGFLIALLLIRIMGYIPIKEFVGTPELSIEVALATAFVLSAIGLAAGLFPARRAANLNVVDCLRT